MQLFLVNPIGNAQPDVYVDRLMRPRWEDGRFILHRETKHTDDNVAAFCKRHNLIQADVAIDLDQVGAILRDSGLRCVDDPDLERKVDGDVRMIAVSRHMESGGSGSFWTGTYYSRDTEAGVWVQRVTIFAKDLDEAKGLAVESAPGLWARDLDGAEWSCVGRDGEDNEWRLYCLGDDWDGAPKL